MLQVVDEDIDPGLVLDSFDVSSSKSLIQSSYDKEHVESIFHDFVNTGPGPGS